MYIKKIILLSQNSCYDELRTNKPHKINGRIKGDDFVILKHRIPSDLKTYIYITDSL